MSRSDSSSGLLVSRAAGVAALLWVLAWGYAPQCLAQAQPADTATIVVKDAGLSTPESVLHDRVADLYIVSNINGSPLAKDGNGFLSRISPEGKVLQLHWVQGGTSGAVLDAPKGLAIHGDTLYVADIDAVRLFHRETGKPLGSWPVRGATFLNDLAVADNGTLFASDSGLKAGEGGFAPSGTDAIYRFDAKGQATAIAAGKQLSAPNGIWPYESGVLVCTFGSNAVYALDGAGKRTDWPSLPGGQLDGIVRDEHGATYVSSWEKAAVYRIDAAAEAGGKASITEVVSGVPSPADIGIDLKRGRLLIPIFTQSRVEIWPLPH